MGLLGDIVKKGVSDAVSKGISKGVDTYIKPKVEEAASEAAKKVGAKAGEYANSVIEAADEAKKAASEAAKAAAEAGEAAADLEKAAEQPAAAKKPAIASASGEFAKMQAEWENAPEVGYVWTLSIDDDTQMNAMGLAKCKYYLDLSCSHVGREMEGVYRGELSVKADIDLGGAKLLMAAMGGGLSADQNCWFKNSNFLMRLAPYKKEDDEMFRATLGRAGQTEEEAAADALAGSLVTSFNGGKEMQDFESAAPKAMWCDWEYRMTEGDMDMYAKAFVMGGIGKATASQTQAGHKLVGDGKASVPMVGTFAEHYDETIESPFPYTIKVWPDGNAVFELHASTNSAVSIKFYGKMDKIPVGDTIKV